MSDDAFGWPGIPPTWSGGDKDVVSTAIGPSQVWFTIGGGVLNEVFWPNSGRPQLRDLGFLVTGDGFWVEVKREANYEVVFDDRLVPQPRIVHRHDRFVLSLEFVGDPYRDVVLIRCTLTSVNGESLGLHVLAAPHLGGSGSANTAWTDGSSLHAGAQNEHLALLADDGFEQCSVGFVGVSDGWQDCAAHGRPTWNFHRANNGNVALTGTLIGSSARTQTTIALAFATTARGAITLARSSLAQGFDDVAQGFRVNWFEWSQSHELGNLQTPHADALDDLAYGSAVVLRVHEDVTFAGASVASLATPWGYAHDDPGGYHLVWPRDCAETGLALAGCGLVEDARRMLQFLIATQESDGHWAQNFSPDGEPYWRGSQLDEAALPVLLAAKLHELGALHPADYAAVTAMASAAVGHLLRTGPSTDQDRWEESAGINPFTLATVICALIVSAGNNWLDSGEATIAMSTARWWDSQIEAYLYVEDTPLDHAHGTTGHYVRVAPRGEVSSGGGKNGILTLANRNGQTMPANEAVGLEFLALVRYGLREAHDPRVVDTVRIVDSELCSVIDGVPLYRRYQHDGYGEHDDGRPFDGSGVGRLWPLLAGERGHYAVRAGESPLLYLRAMDASTGKGGLIPEQVWDGPEISERRLVPGRPTGSAMPLVWAHAEYLKLRQAAVTGKVVDELDVVNRYVATRVAPKIAHLRDEDLVRCECDIIRFAWDRPFLLHFGIDDWSNSHDVPSELGAFGMHFVLLTRSAVPALHDATSLLWTRRDERSGVWEGKDRTILLAEAEIVITESLS